MSAGVSLLVGHSGVGKTSLLNAVSPELLQRKTGAVTDYHGRGRHTTTRVNLLPLTGGGWVVDSPGIREFGLETIAPGDLARLYPGFGELPNSCRFSDCLHRKEPGCAVRAAVASGALPSERHESYLRLLEETG
jgi:ribosome biogenesis GTPase